jgi:hypothetical protein
MSSGIIMRIATILVASLFACSFALPACSDKKEEAEPFDTLKACFDEHHGEESLSIHDAVVVCCLDHPIAGVHPSCKDTQADCATHVTTELGSAVTASDVQTACTDYISQK